MGVAMIGPAEGEELTLTNTNPNPTIAIFFDGTGDNMYNTDEHDTYAKLESKQAAGKTLTLGEENTLTKNVYKKNTGDKSSYENSYSNVARLFKNYDTKKYPNHNSIYIDGIGTLKLHGDDIMDGTGLGRFQHGIIERVKDACKLVVDALSTNTKGSSNTQIIDTLTIDVFGFSRGAAAARHFVYEITSKYLDEKLAQTPAFGTTNSMSQQQIKYDAISPSHPTIEMEKYGYLGKCCSDNKITINNLVIRFAGLFDTVASYSEKIIWNAFTQTDPKDTPQQFTDDVKELNLNKIGTQALRIIHLTAANELRANFPLSNIKSAGAKGTELVLPGVHSDIGGSYQDKADEEMERLMQITIKDGDPKEIAEANKKLNSIKDNLIQQGWYQADELYIHKKFGGDNLLYYQRCLHAIRKALRNTYSFIPLHIMCQFAIEYNKKSPIPFDLDALTKSDSKTTISNDPLLGRIKDRLVNYAFENGNPIELTSKQRRETIENEPTSPNPSTQYSLQDKTFVQQPQASPLELFPQGNDGDLLSLRHSYLHWSANYDRAGWVLRIIPNYPRIIDNDGNTKRRILEG